LAVDWDKRYREGFYAEPYGAHGLVERFSPLIPRGKPVIDIAMGQGRDLLFLARIGFPVYGLERSTEAIRLTAQAAQEEHRGLITMVQGDAYSLPFKPAAAGCVLVFYFLVREIMADLTGLLIPGGLLLYETFLKRQNVIDGPRNPDYLLDDGELPGYFRDLDLLFYEEGTFTVRGKQRALARYAGRKR
jgi:2-polyprenyl-3-methyl-5-hydroxy-6-metoxy-1,4-benzoquinol methylase